MYSFLKAFLLMTKLLHLSQFYAPTLANSLTQNTYKTFNLTLIETVAVTIQILLTL